MVKQAFCILALFLLMATSVDAQEEKYSNPTLGISVVKPADWSFITKQEALDAFAPSDVKGAVVKMLAKYASAPLLIMTKYKEPYDDVNPVFQLDIQPLDNFHAPDAKAITEAVVGSMLTLYQDFEIVQDPANIMMKGRNAGHAGFNYSMKIQGGRTFPVRAEIWVIPRQHYFLLVTAGTRQDEKTGTRDEIKSILNSLVIEN